MVVQVSHHVWVFSSCSNLLNFVGCGKWVLYMKDVLWIFVWKSSSKMNFLEFHENSNEACFLEFWQKNSNMCLELEQVWACGFFLSFKVFECESFRILVTLKNVCWKKLNAFKRFLTKNVTTQWHAMFNKENTIIGNVCMKRETQKNWCLHYEKYGNLRLAIQLGVSCNDHSTYFYNMNISKWVAWVAIDQSLYVELHMYAICAI